MNAVKINAARFIFDHPNVPKNVRPHSNAKNAGEMSHASFTSDENKLYLFGKSVFVSPEQGEFHFQQSEFWQIVGDDVRVRGIVSHEILMFGFGVVKHFVFYN